MDIRELPINEGEWLSIALNRIGENNIPSNIILHKTLTGIGATHAEIKAKRNSIIIEPNVPVILGKASKHKNLLAIYEKTTKKKIEQYLVDSSIKYKKLLTTPDGFSKIRKASEDLGIDIYTEYFCLFDECEKITQDIDYRENISNPVYDFFQFSGKAFVSATPLRIRHPEIEKQNFYKLEVKPGFEYKKELRIIATNYFLKEFEQRIKEYEDSPNVCIFFNSTQGINRLVKNIIKTDYKIFCSEKSAKQLKNRDFENSNSDFSLPLAKYNFFTSRFFSALDIELKTKPDIIILTDLNEALHTTIDPFTDSIQIQGRFRNFIDGERYNSITHIANFKEDLLSRSEDQIEKEIDEYKLQHEQLTDRLMSVDNSDRGMGIQKMLKANPYRKLLDDRGEINNFAIDNLYNLERVNGYYTSPESLYEAYKKTNFFNPYLIKSFKRYDDSDRFSIKKAKSRNAKIIQIVSLLQNQETKADIESLRNLLREDVVYEKQPRKNKFDSDVIIDAFIAFGSSVFVSVKYSYNKIQEKLEQHNSNAKRLYNLEIRSEMDNEFELGVRIPKNQIKEKLQSIYSRFGITHKITHDTIKDHFKATPHNNDRPATYELHKLEPEKA